MANASPASLTETATSLPGAIVGGRGGVTAALDRIRRIARTWRLNTLNSLVYLLSGGTTVLHTGRFARWRRTWSNWSRTLQCQPRRFERPRTEEELCRLVRSAERVRVVGSGHSFNASPLSNALLLSLDRYDQILSVDREERVVRVQAGIRLKQLNARLHELGLALPLLGSTDAQHVGGLLATDLHGTGRDHGYLSEQVLSLRLVDASGAARTVRRGSPEFHAALGGIGACGLITELELQCVSAFNLDTAIRIVDRTWAEANLDQLLEEHEHLSFYYIAGVDIRHVRMNLWNRTAQALSRLRRPRTMAMELVDMLLSGYLLGLARFFKIARPFASVGLFLMRLLLNGRSTVYPSYEGFRRRLYFQHDELEYGVPYEVHQECLAEVLELLERRRFVTLIEVRFAPDTSQALLGPGVGRRTCFIELAPSLSLDNTRVFAEVERILLRYGGRAHLGKAIRVSGERMKEMFGARWQAFREVQRALDPRGKFVNDFIAQTFGPTRTAEQSWELREAPAAEGPRPEGQPI